MVVYLKRLIVIPKERLREPEAPMGWSAVKDA
jgi:hypothetical protein